MSRHKYNIHYKSNVNSAYAQRHINEAKYLHRKYGVAFDQIKTLFLSLDNNRTEQLFKAYSEEYGRSAYYYALNTYHKWKSGDVQMSGQTMTRLLDLLPLFMTDYEKLTLIKHLRQQALKRLHKNNIVLTLSSPNSMEYVLDSVLGLVQNVGSIEIPSDFREVARWMTCNDAQALNSIVKENELYIATQRLVDLMVQLGIIARLRVLVLAGLSMNVMTIFEIPTASVKINFTKAFWHEGARNMNYSDAEFLINLQGYALTESYKEGEMTFVEYAMRTMTPDEQQRLRQIALKEGIQLDVIMQEMIIKTKAARADINEIIALAERLKHDGQKASIKSEHATASGKTVIEINTKSGPCYIATACYGDFNHPDVITFRNYRDNQLQHSLLGRCFIFMYYIVSPTFARCFTKWTWLSKAVRHYILRPLAQKVRRTSYTKPPQ